MRTTEPDRIAVAVGVVCDDKGRVLIGRRTVKDRYYRKWEFPGGKILSDETVVQALKRELNEEIGIRVKRSTPFLTFPYDYADRKVLLIFHLVRDYEGIPNSCENQELKWVRPSSLCEFDMLEANTVVIQELNRLWITQASERMQS